MPLHGWMRFIGRFPLLLVLTACNPPLLDETSSESRVRIDEGRVFTIALSSADHPPPVIRGHAVSFIGRGRDDESGRDFFEFRADRPGEAEVLIGADYRVLIRVWRPEVPIRRHVHRRRRPC